MPPDVVWTAAMAVAEAALHGVMDDPAVWAEEVARSDAVPLSWPPRIVRFGQREQLLEALAVAAVECVLSAIVEAEFGEAEPDDPRWHKRLSMAVQQLDVADPDVQVVLRVAHRAVQAADEVLVRDFGGKKGAVRLAGKREWQNWVKQEVVGRAVRSGLPRGEALAALGMSRASAYRAMKRGR